MTFLTAVILLHQFNETIGQWISALDAYTLEMLCRKPRAGSWSLGQVYVHITDDTSYFVEQMKAALATTANSEESMHENARTLFRNNAFPDMLLTGPATDDTVPQPQSEEALQKQLVFLKDEVSRLSAADFSTATGKTEHPGLRFFSALEWLQFAEMHMRHHFRQKKRIDALLFEGK